MTIPLLLIGLAMAGPKERAMELTLTAPGDQVLIDETVTVPTERSFDVQVGEVTHRATVEVIAGHDTVSLELWVHQIKGSKLKELANPVPMTMYVDVPGTISAETKAAKGFDGAPTWTVEGVWSFVKAEPVEEPPVEEPAEPAPEEEAPVEEAAAEEAPAE